jgi:histone H3/H4
MTSLEPTKTYWRKCSSCKEEISFGKTYQRCSVSTCNQKKTNYVFCSVNCWDAHLGVENHRESSADEHRAPTQAEFQKEENMSEEAAKSTETEVLVVVSKVKKYIREHSDMNTSQCAIDALTEVVTRQCLQAIENAKSSGRKTVMGKDF